MKAKRIIEYNIELNNNIEYKRQHIRDQST